MAINLLSKWLNKSIITSILAVVLLSVVIYIAKQYKENYTSVFIDRTIFSQVLNEDRKIFIRLPEHYDEAKSYPLIIRTDGNFNLSRWDESLKTLSTSTNVEDSILVSIPNLFWTETRNRDLVPPYARRDVQVDARPASENNPEIFGKADRFLEFIENEVLPYIESEYKVNDNRLLSGFSAGGSFVLYTIINKPHLFTGYFAFSPAAWYDNSIVVDNFTSHIRNIKGKPLFFYLSIGGDENDIITGSFKGLLSAIDLNGPDNLHMKHSYSEGAGHSENPYISVPKALEAYYEFYVRFKSTLDSHQVGS